VSNPTVTLYCKPYVQHWLTIQFGTPVRLPRRSSFKYTFLSCLSKKFHLSREYDRKSYPASIDFKLHINDLVQHGKTIQTQLQHHINNVIEEDLKNQLFVYIHAHVIKGMTVLKASRLYQVELGFTEETFSIDAIRMTYNRKLEEFEKIFCGTVQKR